MDNQPNVRVWDGIGESSATWTPGRMHPIECECGFHGLLVSDLEYGRAYRASISFNKHLRTCFDRKPGTSPYERFRAALAKAAQTAAWRNEHE